MDIKKAIERNLAFKTEYGTGPSLLGGLYNRRFLKRKRYGTSGEQREDTIHEREIKLGPLRIEHRSTNPKLIGNDDYELGLTLFGIFGVSNDKDYWVKLRVGPSIGLLGAIPSPQAAIISAIADCDITVRAGMRFNVSGFIRDMRGEEANEENSDPALWDSPAEEE